MRILDKEKAETLGSVLTSGLGTIGVSTFGVSAAVSPFTSELVLLFCSAFGIWDLLFEISALLLGTSTIEYPPFL
ncbi:hypothetical protein [uncultured Flavobacterium sp.]|uniref:hypothetical protein n=1 Tax=uncultured Flavobacterium sp. TaxID=165435 RepID=UPI0029314753|nr:hypothetical protein [uncultured Flavobacterium sp.]